MRIDCHGQAHFAYTGGRDFDPTRRSAVFIHGAASDHSVWALQARYFAQHGWNVLALDLPGHGQSPAPLLPSVEAMAERVAELLALLDVKQAFVAGHSMGSLIGLHLAAHWPERVVRLALIGTAVPMAVGDALLDAATNEEDKARRMIIDWSFAPASLIGNNQAVPGFWLPGSSLALMRRMAPGVLAHDLRACKAYAGGLDAAARIEQPTLVVIGERDLMTPPKATAKLLETLPKARALRLTQAGHGMLSETPEEVRRALWTFAHEA